MKHHSVSIRSAYLNEIRNRFQSMKNLAEGAMEQISDADLLWAPNEDSNSVAVIIKHMSGNMVSRWTNFFESDGEKPDRDRDGEFVSFSATREELKEIWENGWGIFFKVLDDLKEEDLLRTVYIRDEPHSVIQAIERQMYHYSYHIGQIVYIAKLLKSAEWKSLTVPKKK